MWWISLGMFVSICSSALLFAVYGAESLSLHPWAHSTIITVRLFAPFTLLKISFFSSLCFGFTATLSCSLWHSLNWISTLPLSLLPVLCSFSALIAPFSPLRCPESDNSRGIDRQIPRGLDIALWFRYCLYRRVLAKTTIQNTAVFLTCIQLFIEFNHLQFYTKIIIIII